MTEPLPEQTSVEYRPIPGFTGYQLGSDGSVWSCLVKNEWRRLKPSPCKRAGRHSKYRDIFLTSTPGRRGRKFPLHRLMLLVFVGPCPPGMECCHNDGNPTNNSLSNLRWDTPKANNADMKKHGTVCIGEKNGRAKLNETQVREIRRRLKAGETQDKISKEFHISPALVCYIHRRNCWNHLAD